MNSFNEMELAPELLKGVQAAGFVRPSPIQARAIAPLLEGLDVIGQAKTGTGKTAAYSLPLLQIVNPQNDKVQALVLAPTRELAIQITEEIRRLGRYRGAQILTIYGGQPIAFQLNALRRGVHVVVGTPGRVIDHIKRGALHLNAVRFVVIDEADVMLEMGFIEDVELILNRVPHDRQLSLFSATMPQRIVELSEKYMRRPERILIDSDEPSVETLEQYYLITEGRHLKLRALAELLARESPSSVIVFCRTKSGTRKLASELVQRRLKVVALHGDLTQSQRDHAMRIFRAGRASVLVATDVASRGIDIRRVNCIINYEVPENPLLYFHRVGRTARAGDAGKAYTLVSEEEFSDFARIRSLTKAPIKPLRVEDERHDFHSPRVRPGGWGKAGFRARGLRGRFSRRERLRR